MSGRRRLLVAAGFLLAAAIRLAWLSAFRDNWDMGTYRDFARFAGRGAGLYRDILSYHFAPAFALTLWGIGSVAGRIGVPFEKAVGFALLLADAVSAWLLYRISRDNFGRSVRAACGVALLFFANPVSVFVTGFHAQFDNLSIAFLLAAVYFAGRRAGPAPVAASLSGSLLFKHVTWFHPLLFFRRERGPVWRSVAVALAPYAVFAASFLPYWKSRRVVAGRFFGYASLAEDYGTAMLRRVPGVPDWAPTALFVVATLAAVFFLRRLEPARACLLLFLVMLVFLPGIVEYYFVWPIALGSLIGGAGYLVYTVLVSAFFLGSPDGLELPIRHLPGWHGLWWGTVFWLAWELRRLSKERAA